ncbi:MULTISPECIES: ribosomal protein S18-alanine N-acetyltransferase [Parabacteroides]|uniref:ribosomal protein S18-alanine N-acetyltransferase n=1 Tax=Parabacteroides leei TaxID=2939491 RepID=UPI001899147C|nr:MULTISPECIES: ribosomal protein S18-alanine N-acetyltransferase [Parabacteroides]MCL3850106.1 ribosomal protein S18-alanine N-acetyltransferase [Parabacteroides leei]
MEKELEIRQAVRSDLDSILEIETICFGADSFSRRQFLYLITQAKGIFYVVTDKGKVIAYSSLISNARTHNLRIYSIAVHPDARGRKLGQLLMEKAIGFARSHQLKKITLEVNVTNEAAISLYLTNGFEPVHIIYNYYADGSNAYYMQKMVQT